MDGLPPLLSISCKSLAVKFIKQSRRDGMTSWTGYTSCLAYSVVLVDRWGATDDLATSSLHSSRLSVFLMAAPSDMPVHSGMLSSHLFLCLPRLRPPCTVPCRIVLASPEDLVTRQYHFSLRFLLWSRGLRGAQWLAEFCFAPHRLRCGLCR